MASACFNSARCSYSGLTQCLLLHAQINQVTDIVHSIRYFHTSLWSSSWHELGIIRSLHKLCVSLLCQHAPLSSFIGGGSTRRNGLLIVADKSCVTEYKCLVALLKSLVWIRTSCKSAAWAGQPTPWRATTATAWEIHGKAFSSALLPHGELGVKI